MLICLMEFSRMKKHKKPVLSSILMFHWLFESLVFEQVVMVHCFSDPSALIL